jgi:hypothetical protein
MPQAQLTNIIGAGGETPLASGPVTQDAVNQTASVIPQGTLCAAVTPITGVTTAVFAVAPTSTVATTAPLDIGPVVAGPSPGSTSIPASGGTGQLCTHGQCRALVDNSVTPTVVGHRLIRSAATAGLLADAGTTVAAAGLNYGVVLEAVATGAAGTLVNIWYEKT